MFTMDGPHSKFASDANKKEVKKLTSQLRDVEGQREAAARQYDDLTMRLKQAEETRDNIHKELTAIKSGLDRFKDERYISWILSGLGLQYAKEGLENIMGIISRQFYDDMITDIQNASKCNQCDLRETGKNDPRNPSKCPKNVCGTLKRVLESQSALRIDWKSIPKRNITTVADLTSLYLPSFLMASYSSPAKADISALLNLMENCGPFKVANLKLVKQVRESRNAIMHSGTMQLDSQDRNAHLDNCISLLLDKPFKDDNSCKEAIEKIRQIYNANVHIKHLKAVERSILDQVDKSHSEKIDELRQKLSASDCTVETTDKLKREIKEIEESQAKLKVLHEEHGLGTSDIDRRKQEYGKLYAEADRKLQQDNVNTETANLKQAVHDKDAKVGELQDTIAKMRTELDHVRKRSASKEDHSIHVPGSGDILRQAPTDVKATQVGTINVRTADDTCYLSGSAVLPGDKLVLSDYENSKIKLLNLQTSEVTSQLEVSNPWDVATITADQVAVTLCDNARKIVFVTVTSVLKLDREISVDGKCTSIVYNNDSLIVAFDNPVKIQIMTLDGNVQKTIECPRLFQSLYHIALNSTHDTMYVSDSMGHSVKRLGLDGEVEAEYEDKQLRGPAGIIVDQQGRVIVCGRNSHNLHLLTANLTKIKLLVDELFWPTSLSLCQSTGRLYVGRFLEDNLIVYQLS